MMLQQIIFALFCPKLTTLEVGLWPIFEAVSKWPIWLSHSQVNRERKAQMFAKSWIVMDWIPEIGFFEYLKSTKNGFTKQVEHKSILLRYFCQIFDDFSKFCSAFSVLQFEKWPNIPTIWQNDGSIQLSWKTNFYMAIRNLQKNRNPSFSYPIRH